MSLSHLTDEQVIERHVFSAYRIVGRVRTILDDDSIQDDWLDTLLETYDTFGDELKSRRGDDA